MFLLLLCLEGTIGGGHAVTNQHACVMTVDNEGPLSTLDDLERSGDPVSLIESKAQFLHTYVLPLSHSNDAIRRSLDREQNDDENHQQIHSKSDAKVQSNTRVPPITCNVQHANMQCVKTSSCYTQGPRNALKTSSRRRKKETKPEHQNTRIS
jgi:hypothetical protein